MESVKTVRSANGTLHADVDLPAGAREVNVALPGADALGLREGTGWTFFIAGNGPHTLVISRATVCPSL
jgi:hypothetical protein